MDRRRKLRAADALWVAGLAAIAAATLRPAFDPEPVFPLPVPGGADLLRNVLLFVPLGAGLALRGLGLLPTTALAGGVSLAVELAQLAMPGRTSSLWDLLANTCGAALAALAVSTLRVWARPTPAAARRLALGASLAAVCVLAATGVLATPVLPQGVWFSDWTRAFHDLVPYGGDMRGARIDGHPLPHTRLGSRPEALLRALHGDFRLELEAVAGPPPEGLAPLLTLRVGNRAEVMLVGAWERDLAFRQRRLADELGFERRTRRLVGALADVAPGLPFQIVLARRGASLSARVDEGPPRSAGATLGEGWTLLVWDMLLPGAAHPWASSGWIGALVLPIGFWGRRDRAGGLAVALPLGALATLPAVLPVLPSPPEQYLGALAGLAAGLGLRHAVRGVSPTHRR